MPIIFHLLTLTQFKDLSFAEALFRFQSRSVLMCFEGNRSFRLRVVSPTVSSPTSRVNSPASDMSVRLRVKLCTSALLKDHENSNQKAFKMK